MTVTSTAMRAFCTLSWNIAVVATCLLSSTKLKSIIDPFLRIQYGDTFFRYYRHYSIATIRMDMRGVGVVGAGVVLTLMGRNAGLRYYIET
jgi:hypothetical protein